MPLPSRLPLCALLLWLLLAGAVGGFVAGLIGIGGGVIFGPVLFFAFSASGVDDPVLTPLTLGSSLLCTFAASASGAVRQHRAGAVAWRTALVVGALAAVAVVLVGRFVTTQPWYDKEAFQFVFGSVLAVVALRMLLRRTRGGNSLSTDGARRGLGALGATGAAAGTLAALAGVGGGVILVPALTGLVRLPLKAAAATSTAAIVLITGTGVLTYVVLGWGAAVPEGALGYVGWQQAAVLALPAVAMAPLGVAAAHRLDVRVVRYAFAVLALVVSARLLWNVLG